MGHHRNARGHDPRHHIGLTGSTLQLHGLAAGLLENAGTRLHRRPHAKVLKRKRQVDHHHGPRRRPGHDLAVVDHLLERGGNRRRATGDHHRHAVAHQHAIDAGLVRQPAGRPVVGRDHREWPTLRSRGSQVEHRDPAGRAWSERHARTLKKSVRSPLFGGSARPTGIGSRSTSVRCLPDGERMTRLSSTGEPPRCRRGCSSHQTGRTGGNPALAESTPGCRRSNRPYPPSPEIPVHPEGDLAATSAAPIIAGLPVDASGPLFWRFCRFLGCRPRV